MYGCPRSQGYSVAPDATVHSAFQRAPARARPATTSTTTTVTSPSCPQSSGSGARTRPVPLPLKQEALASAAFPPYPTQHQPGHSRYPRPVFPLLPSRPVGRPPFPSPSCPHPRVQRGRGLPQAAASASSPRGSWCLPGPTGLTRTTQPQDVRSDGTTASCHAPPLPLLLPLHRRGSVRQRRCRERRTSLRFKG